MKNAAAIVTLVCLGAVSSTQAKWSRIPVMQEKPVNLVSGGTASPISIDTSTGVGQVDNLLGSDIVAAATLAAGKSFFVINLGKPVMVSTSSLSNDGIEGRIVLSASADKAGWATLEEKVVSAADRSIDFKFAGIQAKFLKFEFLLSKGGSIRALSVMGGVTDRGYALKQDPKGEKGQPMNFIGGLGGARLVYAAPQPVNGIDSAATFNKFEFPESDEQYRTLIYDFGQVRIVNEFSSVHSPSPVRFEVFTFDALPEKEDWRGRLAFDPNVLTTKQPVVAYEDKVGTGFLKAKPSKPVKTRYLAMRWEPDFNPPAFVIDSVGSSGAVFNIQGVQVRTVTLANGQTATVTVDPGPAPGAGAEGSGTVTVAISNPDGTVTTTTYQGASGVNIGPGGIQVLAGPDPGTLAGVGTEQTVVGQTTGGADGAPVQMQSAGDSTPGGTGGVTTTTTQTSADGSTTTTVSTNTATNNLGSPTASGSPTNFTTPGQNAVPVVTEVTSP